MNLEGSSADRHEAFERRLGVVEAEAAEMADLIEQGDVSAPVPACGDWDVARLTFHLGFIHRWATMAAATAAEPTSRPPDLPARDASAAELAQWLRDGATTLVAELRSLGPDAPTWHPFPAEQRTWFWARRQAHETALHRWDAESALTGTASLDRDLALELLEEFFDTILPRVFDREQVDPPTASLHVHCTDDDLADGAGEWIVWSDDGSYVVERAHRKGDAALRGTAADLLLVLMGRAPLERVDIVGDRAAADAWLELPGL